MQDGLRLSIKFSSQSEYELDADTPDEKNKVGMTNSDDPRILQTKLFNIPVYIKYIR